MKLKLLLSLDYKQLRSVGSKLGFTGVQKMNKEQLITRLSTWPYKSITEALK